MIRPLTKRRGSGDRYTRPPNIEAVIDAALALDWPALHQRTFVRDRRSPDYLPSECLVHLIRKAHWDRHETIRDQLLAILLGRCEATLAASLPDGRFPKAGYVRVEAPATIRTSSITLRCASMPPSPRCAPTWCGRR